MKLTPGAAVFFQDAHSQFEAYRWGLADLERKAGEDFRGSARAKMRALIRLADARFAGDSNIAVNATLAAIRDPDLRHTDYRICSIRDQTSTPVMEYIRSALATAERVQNAVMRLFVVLLWALLNYVAPKLPDVPRIADALEELPTAGVVEEWKSPRRPPPSRACSALWGGFSAARTRGSITWAV